jgi:glycosyltransferase involved in cell wall biosynthesis
MRILFFSVSDALGGSEIALVDMIASLRRLRPSWHLGLVLPGTGPLLRRAEAAGADCTMLAMPAALTRVGEFASGSSRWPLAAKAVLAVRLAPVAMSLPGYLRRLRTVVRGYQPAILHTNGLKAHVLGARARGGAKVVWHMHEYVGDRALTRALLSTHAEAPAAIVANSASVAADVRQALPKAVAPEVVYNAVDLTTFAADGPADDLDDRAGLRPPSSPVVRVGLVGTFARWKGHDVFLRAMAALPPSLPVRGYVIGEPLYTTSGSQYTLDELKRAAAAAGVQDRVGFTGFLRSAHAMRALDIVVHASTRPEPFGLVIAEAMACGRAVIASAAGGAAEIVESEVDALTHTPGDVEGLAAGIARLAADPELRRQLGRRARATAERRFDNGRLAAELAGVYERLA